MKTENNYSLSAHNTFGIDARCRQFVEYETVDELRDFISRRLADTDSETSLPLLHIGGGSNLLFTTDFPGIVLHSAIKGVEVEMSDAARQEVVVKAGAGRIGTTLWPAALSRAIMVWRICRTSLAKWVPALCKTSAPMVAKCASI